MLCDYNNFTKRNFFETLYNNMILYNIIYDIIISTYNIIVYKIRLEATSIALPSSK